MKFLIDSYSNPTESTQSMYLHYHIDEMEEHRSYITNPHLPLFDTLDAFNPDVYITSIRTLRWDYIEYLKDNKLEIKTFINIDNSKIGDIYNLVEVLKENNVKARFFSNSTKKLEINIKISPIPLMPAIDSNIKKYYKDIEKNQWKNKIDYLVVSDSIEASIPRDIKNNTFHLYAMDGKGDLLETLVSCKNNMFHNYHNIIFTNLSSGITQMFFEALNSGTPTYYANPSENYDELLSKILKTEQTLNWIDKSKVTDFSNIKKHIQEKHKSENRVKSILSQLPQVCNA